MKLLSRFGLFLAILLSGHLTASRAGHEMVEMKESKTVVETPFDKGRQEAQVLAGAFFSFDPGSRDRLDFDIATGTLRLGWMLNTPEGDSCMRGNFEFLVEVFGGGVINGPGNGLVGGSLLLRYNWVQPDTWIVPYFQIGAGGLYNDAYRDHSQRALGEALEFNLQATVGCRFMMNPHWALVLEGGYLHISNGGLAERNVGVDTLGGRIGVNYFF
jgi:hypothetical protein